MDLETTAFKIFVNRNHSYVVECMKKENNGNTPKLEILHERIRLFWEHIPEQSKQNYYNITKRLGEQLYLESLEEDIKKNEAISKKRYSPNKKRKT